MKAEELLLKHKLRKTGNRLAVLSLFAGHSKAFSHSEIQAKMGSNMDRVTLYRILDAFEKCGILHKIPDDEVSVKYALCDHDHSVEHHHSDDHAHFKCHECGDTICLEDYEIPSLKSPHGFRVDEKFLLLGGVCDQCQ